MANIFLQQYRAVLKLGVFATQTCDNEKVVERTRAGQVPANLNQGVKRREKRRPNIPAF